MARILIISDISAPYRVEVFKALSEVFDVTMFFNKAASGERNPMWYRVSDKEFSFDILDNDESKSRYEDCIKRIKDFDLVLCYDPWAKRSRALQRLCMLKKVPFVLNADGALDINKRFPKKQVKTFYVKRAALCFAGCEKAVEYFKTYGAKTESIIKHSFTSLHRNQISERPYSSEQKTALRNKLGIENKTVFLFVGQFIHRKGIDILLKAWENAPDNAQLFIIGGGPLRSEYEAIIVDKGIKNVTILDFKPEDELFEYYAAADVFVFPTREDIWGLVIGEAMANGLPVISTNRCTAANELVENGENGFIFDREDTDTFSKYIHMLAESAEIRAEFGEKAISAIKEHCYENVATSHIQSIRALLKVEK